MEAAATVPGRADAVPGRRLLVTRPPALRRCPHPVAFADEIGAAPIARRLLGIDLAVSRDADGKVGAAAPGDDAAAPMALRVEEALGLVWVTLDAQPLQAIPVLAEFTDPRFRAIRIGVIRVAASAATVIDNNTDATHVAFVHEGSFGAGQDPRIPVSTVRRTGYGIEIATGAMGVAAAPGGSPDGAEPDREEVRETRTEMWLPFTQIGRFVYSDGRTHVLFKALCPVDDKVTDVHFTVLRDDCDDPADDEVVRRFELTVEHEDRAMLETLPAGFQLDPRALAHTAHDRPGIEYRRALAALLDRG
jgi:phenylpropionate dioxygenase-like ring-hydroxylating dioxygenase large terminal subunit